MIRESTSEDAVSGKAAAASNVLTGALALIASGCAALPLLHHVGPLEIAALSGVVASSAWAAWRWLRASRDRIAGADRDADEAELDTGATGDGLPVLLAGVLPIWLQHLGSVKSQTESAITELVTSFSSITEQFEKAGFKGAGGSASDGQQATISLLTLCERQLRPVISSMNSLLDSKGALVSSVNELALVTSELQGMASGVSQIAAQTNMLALNAAIEAARAGPTGRGFAVIAKEIRTLSQVSAQTGKQITDRIGQVTRIMKTTVAAAANASIHDRSAIELSGSVVQDVLSHVRELSVNAEAMRGQGNIIRADVENLLVSLQFQDRVSQIISVIDADIKRLEDAVEGDEDLPATDEWLHDLQRHYTMNDQRQNHAAEASTVPARAQAPASTETEFF
jgi:methyl-accepting chemotaxis protein